MKENDFVYSITVKKVVEIKDGFVYFNDGSITDEKAFDEQSDLFQQVLKKMYENFP